VTAKWSAYIGSLESLNAAAKNFVYIPIYVHTYVHMYIPTYVHTYICTYLHMYTPTYIVHQVITYVCCMSRFESQLSSTLSRRWGDKRVHRDLFSFCENF
jgi:hypothetical protein